MFNTIIEFMKNFFNSSNKINVKVHNKNSVKKIGNNNNVKIGDNVKK